MKVVIAQTAERGHVAAEKIGLSRREYRVAIHPVDLHGVKADDMIVAMGAPVFREHVFWMMVDTVRREENRTNRKVPRVEL